METDRSFEAKTASAKVVVLFEFADPRSFDIIDPTNIPSQWYLNILRRDWEVSFGQRPAEEGTLLAVRLGCYTFPEATTDTDMQAVAAMQTLLSFSRLHDTRAVRVVHEVWDSPDRMTSQKEITEEAQIMLAQLSRIGQQ